jgi:hypothetical protein
MHYCNRGVRPLREDRPLDETSSHRPAKATGAGNADEKGSRVSIRTGGQVERLLWAAAEARRLRDEPVRVAVRPEHRAVVLALPPEQFTTEWQTPYLAEPA